MIIEPRPYRNEDDLEAMRALLAVGRKAGNPTFYIHSGDLNWWLYFLIKDEDRRQIIHLWEDERADGALVGWSLLSPGFQAFDVFVHPDFLGNEQAEAIWIWTEERARSLIQGQGGKTLRTMWVGERDTQLIACLERLGFARSSQHLVRLARALTEPIPDHTLPTGFLVRHIVGEQEVAERAAAAYATFRSRKPFERYRQDYLMFMRSVAYNPELDLVVVAPDGQFGAFCVCWLDTVNCVGLFEPVGTSPDFRRRGLATAVLLEGLQRMKARGMTSANVCVAFDNPAAQALYASVGFQLKQKILAFEKHI